LEAQRRESRARAERHRWREKREGERDNRFHRGRLSSKESTGAAWNLCGMCGRDGKLPRKASGSACRHRILFTTGDADSRPWSARSDGQNNSGDMTHFFVKKSKQLSLYRTTTKDLLRLQLYQLQLSFTNFITEQLSLRVGKIDGSV
jgi:hypothetical protein